MNEHIRKKETNSNSLRYNVLLLFLFFSALLLAGRSSYFYLANEERFPITTIKVSATYQHVTHKDLEAILAKYLNASFFSLPVNALQKELNGLNWVDSAYVERIWPDTLKIKIEEKNPVAIWEDALMTASGSLFNKGSVPSNLNLPQLKGPISQQLEVLQVYEKLSKILSEYGLKASGLRLRENQSWVLTLSKDIKIYLGKNDMEMRLERFCKAYPAVFAEKIDQLAGVDLRYPRGMAVQWKQQTGR